jgi:hypothetical protein
VRGFVVGRHFPSVIDWRNNPGKLEKSRVQDRAHEPDKRLKYVLRPKAIAFCTLSREQENSVKSANSTSRLTISAVASALLMLVPLGAVPLSEQQAKAFSAPVTTVKVQITGFPEKCSLHHIVFSALATPSFEQPVNDGTPEEWQPRDTLQQLKRSSATVTSVTSVICEGAEEALRRVVASNKPVVKNDWSVSLGAGTAAAQYPAKDGLNYTEAPDYANDFDVFPMDRAGVSGSQLKITGINNIYSGHRGICPPGGYHYGREFSRPVVERYQAGLTGE